MFYFAKQIQIKEKEKKFEFCISGPINIRFSNGRKKGTKGREGGRDSRRKYRPFEFRQMRLKGIKQKERRGKKKFYFGICRGKFIKPQIFHSSFFHEHIIPRQLCALHICLISNLK